MRLSHCAALEAFKPLLSLSSLSVFPFLVLFFCLFLFSENDKFVTIFVKQKENISTSVAFLLSFCFSFHDILQIWVYIRIHCP